MARYVSYSHRLERRARNSKLFFRLLILMAFFFILTHFFVRIYKIKDSFSVQVPSSSFVVATFYYPLFGNNPERGDLVFVRSFSSYFFSWAKLGEFLSFSALKASWVGREKANTQRLYKIIAKTGDTVKLQSKSTLGVLGLGQAQFTFYSLPEGSAPLLELGLRQERLLEEGEYLGMLTDLDKNLAIHTFRYLKREEIVAQARVNFKI